MPVLLIAEADLPEEAYAEIAGKMTPLIRAAKGLIFHAGRPDPAGGCWPGVLLGRGARRELLKRGLALKTRAGPAVYPHPGPLTWFQCVDDIEGTRARHAREDSWARERGDDRMRAERLGYLAMVELQAGQWDLAEQHAGRSCETLEQGDVSGRSAYAFAWRSLIDAYRGRVDRARTTLQPLVAEAARTEKAWWGAILLSVVGFVEFSTYLVENYHPGLGAEELRRIVSRPRCGRADGPGRKGDPLSALGNRAGGRVLLLRYRGRIGGARAGGVRTRGASHSSGSHRRSLRKARHTKGRSWKCQQSASGHGLRPPRPPWR